MRCCLVFMSRLASSDLAPFTHGIQFVLAQMTLDRSPGFVLGALIAQLTSRADFLGCRVITAFASYAETCA